MAPRISLIESTNVYRRSAPAGGSTGTSGVGCCDDNERHSFIFSHQLSGLTKRIICPGFGEALAFPQVLGVTTPC